MKTGSVEYIDRSELSFSIFLFSQSDIKIIDIVLKFVSGLHNENICLKSSSLHGISIVFLVIKYKRNMNS